MGFGSELRDQLPDINQLTSNGILFLHDFRDFLKDRATIEQQYSQAMDKLTKATIKKFKKSGQSFFGAGNPFNLASQDIEALGTCAHAFLTLLQETESMAKSRASLADAFANEVLNALKFEIKRKEDARQKHIAFADQLSKNYENQKAETLSLRNNYRSAGKELDAAFAKYDKAADDKAAEKASKEWNDVLVEKTDKRNEYIISLVALNSHKKTFYFSEMPILMDHMQTLNEHITQRAKEVMTDYIGLENTFISELQASNAKILQSLEQVNGPQDSALFIQHLKKPWTEPPNFAFEPYSDGESAELSTSPSQVFLLNTLQKCNSDTEGVQKEIAAQNKANEGLKNLYDAYQKDPKLGDPIEVWQNVIEGERSFLVKETQRIKIQAEIETIRAAVGPIELILHQLKTTGSGTCAVCGASFTFMSKGSGCTACPIKFHSKCQSKVPPLCGVEFHTPVPRIPTGSGSFLTRRHTTVTSSSLSNTSLPSSSSPSLSPSSQSLAKAKVLYQYDAQNEGDLSVVEGDILDVVQFDDGQGWLTGVLNGVTGVIPANYAEKITTTPSKAPSLLIPPTNPNPGSANPSPKYDKVRALYDYQAQSDIELSLTAGDVIEVTNREIEAGWWEGRLNGRVGQFPENYVEPA